MKKMLLSALIVLICIEGLSFVMTLRPSGADWGGFGFMQFVFALFALLIGLVLTFVRRTREAGKGLVLGATIVLLIGLAVCSNTNVKL